jgi:hypothetical protein
VLAACPEDERAAPAEAQPPAETQPAPAATAVPQPIPGAGSFALVTDQDRSKLTATATADGQQVRGEVTLIVGGLYLVDGDLDGATGSISGNLRYIETGRPMWDQYLSESFFEALQPEREMAHAGVDRIRLPAAADRSAPRRGEAMVTLGLARGSQKFVVPIEVSRSGQAWRLRSLEPSALDLGTLGYGERLGPMAQALGLGEIASALLIDFDLYLEPMSPHAAGRSLP